MAITALVVAPEGNGCGFKSGLEPDRALARRASEGDLNMTKGKGWGNRQRP